MRQKYTVTLSYDHHCGQLMASIPSLLFLDLERNRRSLDFQIIAGSADHYYRSADYSHASSHVTRGDEGRGERGDEGLDCTDGFETGEIIVDSRYKDQSRVVRKTVICTVAMFLVLFYL